MIYSPILRPFHIGQRVTHPALKSDTRMRVVGYSLNGDVVVQLKGGDRRYVARPIDLKPIVSPENVTRLAKLKKVLAEQEHLLDLTTKGSMKPLPPEMQMYYSETIKFLQRKIAYLKSQIEAVQS